MFGLQDEVINKINAVFCNFSNIDKVIIYSSRAMGNVKNGSDVDITLVGDSLHSTALYKLEDAIDELYLPYSLDI